MGRYHSLAARRAVFRWAWRMFRRDWRQQLLVLLLLLAAVASAVGATAVVFNLAAPNEGSYGDASGRIDLGVTDPHQLSADLATIEDRFGAVDVVGYRHLPVPGSVRQVELRYQDPGGRYGTPMLALREGRYPGGPDEAAVTIDVARTIGLTVGSRLVLGEAEPDRTVVGIVENPHQLADEFVLLAPPAPDRVPVESVESVTVLVEADQARLSEVRADLAGPAVVSSPPDVPLAAALGMLLATTIGLLLVCLVAGASFAVIAGRRLRQLGMLAAIGATPRQLRLVTIAGGIVVGIVSTVSGTGLGLLAWFAVAPRLEGVAGHRIDALHLPWWAILICVALALATSALAAWWPARALARVPVFNALSARPPRPRPARRAGVVALVLLGFGIVLLQYADRTRPRTGAEMATSGQFWQLALLVGTLVTIVGALFVSPLLIRLLAAAGSRAPIAARLALRDLGRHQARSAAALSAITLGLAVTVFFVITAAAGMANQDEGNLSDRHLMVWIGDDPQAVPELTPARMAGLTTTAERLAATLDGAAMVPLEAAVAPGREDQGRRTWVRVGRPRGDDTYDPEPLFVATGELLAYHRIRPGSVDPATDVLTVHTEELVLLSDGLAGPPESVSATAELAAGNYTSLPRSLVTLDGLDRHGWQAVPTGWLIEASEQLTSAQVAAAREAAAAAGLTVETRRDEQNLVLIGRVMTAAAAVLALGILAMTIGLIRGEAGRELRVLAATGASTRLRRTLTATTAGALATAGALLGTGCAYLVAGPANPHVDLTQVPVLNLSVIVVGIPLVAAGAGWLLAGREPPALARAALE